MDTLVAAAIHGAKNSLTALATWLAQAQRDFAAQQSLPTAQAGQQHAVPGLSSPALTRAEILTNQLGRQLTELLLLYRAGSGSLRLTVEDHLLTDFLADVMAEFSTASALETTELALTVTTEFAAASRINSWAFDAYLVKFVLLDALRNALRHARQRVFFTLLPAAQGGLCFCIEDDGPGYPDEILRASEYQPHSNQSEASAENPALAAPSHASGTGLGLSFAQLIAHHHVLPADKGDTQIAAADTTTGAANKMRRGKVVLSNRHDPARPEQVTGASFSLILP